MGVSSDERKKKPIVLTSCWIFWIFAKGGESPVNILSNRLGGLNMGSFPMILKFDSLEWYFCDVIVILYGSFNFLKIADSRTNSFFLKFTNNITYHQYWYWWTTPHLRYNRFSLSRLVNSSKDSPSQGLWYRGYSTGSRLFFKFFRFLNNFRLSLLFFLFFHKKIDSLVSFLYNNFRYGYNVLFFDTFVNYNYIPVSNRRLVKRGKKNLKKLIKFFRVNCVVLLNISNKRFIFRKLKKRGVIVLSFGSRIWSSFLDFSLPSQGYVSDYLFYLLVMLVYRKVKITTSI